MTINVSRLFSRTGVKLLPRPRVSKSSAVRHPSVIWHTNSLHGDLTLSELQTKALKIPPRTDPYTQKLRLN